MGGNIYIYIFIFCHNRQKLYVAITKGFSQLCWEVFIYAPIDNGQTYVV